MFDKFKVIKGKTIGVLGNYGCLKKLWVYAETTDV